MKTHRDTAFALIALLLLAIVYAVLVGVWEPWAGGAL